MRRLLNSRTSQSPPPSPPLSPPHRVHLIVKLGGSCLTEKNRPHTLHPTLFQPCIDTIVRLYNSGHSLILIHGAGSFGHYEAATHKLSSGSCPPIGVSDTHIAVRQLNVHVVAALVAKGVPAIGVSPLLVTGKTRAEFVASLLDRGHLPVLHGDAVYLGDGRTAVLSGDALVSSLAIRFGFVKRVVFLCDVEGVLEKPPGQGGAVVKKVTVDEKGGVSMEGDVNVGTSGVDVTGGIVGKVVAAAKCVAAGGGRIVAFIARVGSEDAERVLRGELPEPWSRLSCTRICFEGGRRDDEEQDVNMPSVAKRRWFTHVTDK